VTAGKEGEKSASMMELGPCSTLQRAWWLGGRGGKKNCVLIKLKAWEWQSSGGKTFVEMGDAVRAALVY